MSTEGAGPCFCSRPEGTNQTMVSREGISCFHVLADTIREHETSSLNPTCWTFNSLLGIQVNLMVPLLH